MGVDIKRRHGHPMHPAPLRRQDLCKLWHRNVNKNSAGIGSRDRLNQIRQTSNVRDAILCSNCIWWKPPREDFSKTKCISLGPFVSYTCLSTTPLLFTIDVHSFAKSILFFCSCLELRSSSLLIISNMYVKSLENIPFAVNKIIH